MCIYICKYIYIYIYTYTYTYIHIHIHTYTHTYVNIYIYIVYVVHLSTGNQQSPTLKCQFRKGTWVTVKSFSNIKVLSSMRRTIVAQKVRCILSPLKSRKAKVK